MKLVGNSSTVCQIDGKWRYPLPQCLGKPVALQLRFLLVRTCRIPWSFESKGCRRGKCFDCSALRRTSGLPREGVFGFRKRYSCAVHGGATRGRTPGRMRSAIRIPQQLQSGGLQQRYLDQHPQMRTCTVKRRHAVSKSTNQFCRCKHLPKPPKNGMVIAPKMEHNMKARFKCKDGFVIKGKEFIECSYGNWTGEIPICQEVYCPYPGLVEHGKILLVGNMGLYDYRPYVRKIANNKQIMYDCDKGYVLEEGPPGATCLGGKWSPSQLPRYVTPSHPHWLTPAFCRCVLGQHPRLRWSRRRRSIIMEGYKRAFMRHHKLIYDRRDKDYWQHMWDMGSPSLGRRLLRRRRALKGGSSSRAVGLSVKGSGGSLNLRRGNKKTIEPDLAFEKKQHKHKMRIPCDPLSSEPYVNIEVVKHGRDPNVSFSSGTVVKIACGKGYGSNMPVNKTAKCVRGKWRPRKPSCFLRKA